MASQPGVPLEHDLAVHRIHCGVLLRKFLSLGLVKTELENRKKEVVRLWCRCCTTAQLQKMLLGRLSSKLTLNISRQLMPTTRFGMADSLAWADISWVLSAFRAHTGQRSTAKTTVLTSPSFTATRLPSTAEIRERHCA